MTAEEGGRVVAWHRPENEPCEALTPGCSINHTAERDEGNLDSECETW